MSTQSLGRDVIRFSLLGLGALVLVYAPLLFDPLVRHDDFPALLGTKEMAYIKALDEGRWLNYWWQFRPYFWPAPVSFVLYLIASAVFAASTALIVFGRDAPGWYRGYFTLFVVLSIPTFLISFWFNTLLPGAWVIALFALAVVFLPHRIALALMLIAVPLSFMAYTTYPFLLLTLLLLSHKAPQTYKSMVTTLLVFFVSLVLAVVSVYSLNYLYHGVFGIPIAEWRAPTEAKTLDDLIVNLGKLKRFLMMTVRQFGGGTAGTGAVLLLFFVGAWVCLFRWQRFTAIAVLAAALAGLAPLFAKSLMSGVLVPVRAYGWIWILIGFTFTTATLHMAKTPGRWASVARITIMYVLLIKLILFGRATYLQIPEWQKTTRDLAASIPEGTSAIHIYGEFLGLNGARSAGIQFSRGLQLRLAYLTGAEVFICHKQPEDCEKETPPFDPMDWTHVPVVESRGEVSFLLLPPPPVGP
ncbi:hypothetical protein NBRC116589_30970 [Ruegeria sp. HU-ET01832]|uniref:hypothetical protein n=1 Tax=Ruegeria sp. HU-ET01832 TaxID=3135906 RepID=UPI00147C3A81